MQRDIASQPTTPSWPGYATKAPEDRLQARPETRAAAVARARAQAGMEMVAIANGRGERELFVAGRDGRITNYYPDPASETGYRAADTGLSGSAIAAGLDALGRIVLFAAQGLRLAYVSELREPGERLQSGTRWTAPAACAVPLPADAVALDAILAATIGGTLLVAVLGVVPGASGVLHAMAWGAWQDGEVAPRMQGSKLLTRTRHCAWTGSSVADAAFVAFEEDIVRYGIVDGRVARRTVPPFVARDIATIAGTTAGGAGEERTLAILEDGRLHQLACVDGACRWEALDLEAPCRKLALARDAGGAVHAFALGIDNRLWHLAPSDAPGRWLPPVPVLANVLRFGPVQAPGRAGGNLDLFIVGSARNAVAPMLYELPQTVAEAPRAPAHASADDPMADLYSKDSVGTIRRRIVHKTREAFDLATQEWLAWYHPGRMLQPFGHLPPR